MNLRELKRLASDRSFARGEVYFNEGRVHALADRDGVLTAVVRGQKDYQVRLQVQDTDIEYLCDCPVGFDGEFCKHLVAATLAWMNPDADFPVKAGEREQPETNEGKIQAFLELQDKRTLIGMLVSEAAENSNLCERLLLQAARIHPEAVDLRAYRNAIARATRTSGFVHYHAAYDFARRIHQVIDSIAALLDDGQSQTVIELTEYMLARLETAIGQIDDSDGHMGDILADLHKLHHSACLAAKPDPVSLARHLFEWEIKSDWEIFYGAATNYVDVFGAEGLAEYRRLAEADWSGIRPLGPGDKDEDRYGRRFRITSIMEAIVRQTGDAEAIVEVKRRDLSNPYSYLQIAEIYRTAHVHDKALEWAEQGLQSFARRDSRLVEFVAEEYHRRSRHEDAMKLIWDQFVEWPFLNHYQELRRNARKVRPTSSWPVWREKALAHLRKVIEKEQRDAKERAWVTHTDNSRLVEIFLWEKRYEEAWQEASAGGCSDTLWLRVAVTREEKHPGDVVPIYKEMIPGVLKQANNSAYEEAVKLVRKVGELLHRLQREAEFGDYLAGLRVEYKRKRNFIKLLEEFQTL